MKVHFYKTGAQRSPVEYPPLRDLELAKKPMKVIL